MHPLHTRLMRRLHSEEVHDLYRRLVCEREVMVIKLKIGFEETIEWSLNISS